MSVLARDLMISRYLESLDPLPSITLDREDRSIDGNSTHDSVPRSSLDAPLTAFAQLGALRLGATRALISLIDSTNQYILSEATQTLSLQDDSTYEAGDSLWLGATTIPRQQGVCEHVLELNAKNIPGSDQFGPAQNLIINDLREDARSRSLPHVIRSPYNRFYAGSPIVTPQGHLIGVYCVFGTQPRNGLSMMERRFLQDMSKTVMDHLSLCLVRENDRRKEKMLRGLSSFVQGMSEIETMADPAEEASPPSDIENTSPEVLKKIDHLTLQDKTGDTTSQGSPPVSVTISNSSLVTPQRPTLANTREIRSSRQPSGAETLFSRAANTFRQSSDFAGVMFIDASILSVSAHNKRRSRSTKPTSSCDSTAGDDASDPNQEHDKSLSEDLLECPRVLGSSVVGENAHAERFNDSTLLNLTLQQVRSILRRYSNGKVLHFGQDGSFISSEGSSSSSGESRRRRRTGTQDAVFQPIRTALPNLKDLLVMPLWHHEQQRWTALQLCWTTQSSRRSARSADLIFSRICCDSIMNNISRLDAAETDQIKTSFIASISHEMRSPLNGICGSVQILSDLVSDSLQADLLSSIDRCGKTLLDSLDNILDYSKINDFTQQRTRRSLLRPNSRYGSGPKSSLTKDVDLSVISEEVVEAVFAGQNFKLLDRDTIGSDLEIDTGFSDEEVRTEPESAPVKRKIVRILLEVGEGAHVLVSGQAGSWRRIVMNLFGNALKFTHQGVITVALNSKDIPNKPRYRKVDLTVTDTGIGISQQFQTRKLFAPFSQEDSFTPGTGLGLSNVKRIVDSLGGQLEIHSEVGKGTTVKVSVPFQKAEHSSSSHLLTKVNMLSSLSRRLRGKKVCVVERPAIDTKDQSDSGFEIPQLGRPLANAMRGWFGTDISYSRHWTTDSYDILICAEPSLETLARIRERNGDGPPVQTILICLDAMEATALGGDNRLTNDKNPIEIIQQPCGPWKLARVLQKCLDRLDSHEGTKKLSISESTSKTSSPMAPSTSPPSTPSPLPETKLSTPPSILIVDDNHINLKLLSAYLTKQNLEHLSAVNGQEAVDIYKTKPFGSIQYILMDLSMPVLDGLSATRLIRQYEEQQPPLASSTSPSSSSPPSKFRSTVIALTGLASTTARIEARNAGIDDYMTKPVHFKALKELLESSSTPQGTPG